MAISRWNPMRELLTMHDQLNRLFDENFGKTQSAELEYGAWSPAVDLREEEGQYVIEADMPGMKREDIEVHLENNLLTIRGERKFEAESQKETYHRIERAYGRFTRSFTLPSRVEADKISATYKDGILQLIVPKAEESKPKRIAIKG
ncbi:MAG: Hsp20/alpha crystallin family protein [Acidobacteriota bacterium]